EIAGLLADPNCRLLTLVGPGGMGKTRLAVQTATALANAFSSGACFVLLAPVAEPELVAPAIAAALQLKFKEHTNEIDPHLPPAEQLLDYLREKDLLLVMDNFEHLIPAAGIISDILAAAPRIKVLATSRQRLNLAEEWALAVQGMAYPADDLSKLEDYSATRLFLQVARQVQVGFEPGEADLRAIGRVCRLVEGMPLGIELAATWVRMLSFPEIAAEIERSLDFLTSSRRGVPERHRDLRAVFEHSWSLLSESERAAFRKLSLFHGGFTREAAAQVAGAALGLLSALVDKSLVRRNPDGRYDLHEVLKRYAAEKLDEVVQQRAEAREAYHHYYLAMLQDLAENLKGPRQKAALERQSVEDDNLRAAWRLTVEIGDLDELYQGLLALHVIYELGVRHHEAAELLEPTLQRLRSAPADEQANNLYLPALAFTLALLALYYARSFERADLIQACYTEAIDLLPRLPAGLMRARVLLATAFGAHLLEAEQVNQNFQECVQVFKAAGDQWGFIAAIIAMTDVQEVEQGHVEQSRQLILQALELSRQTGNRWTMALCYNFLALAAFWTADYEEGLRYGLEARSIYLEFKDRWRAMEAQVQLGRIETDCCHYAQARSYFLENMQFAGEMGARYFVALNQDCLGYVELLDGNLDQAGVYYQRSLEIYRQMGLKHGQGMSLGNLGDVAMRQGDPQQARQYFLQSLQFLSLSTDSWGMSVTFKKLGNEALVSGRFTEAE
ncbi:MAG TPA: tetratricopeptide repeat protein, partial [Polyangia bacterium]